jgi:hypothetical protein
MRTHTLAGITLTIFLAAHFAGAPAAHAQAAAESVLLNSNSAAATTKAGTSMGNVLNAASSKLGNQVQKTTGQGRSIQTRGGKVTVVHHPKTPVQTPAAATKPATNSGSLITSIQGGRLSSAAPPPAPPAPK